MMIAPGGPPNLNLICSLCYYKYIFFGNYFCIPSNICIKQRGKMA